MSRGGRLEWMREPSSWLARRAASHLPPLGVLAIVFALGVGAASDFGLANDQLTQYRVGQFTVEYILGETDNLLRHNLRYYGAVFEVALRAVERVLGLADYHHIFLSRYILSHCFFLLGALACYLLAQRLFQSRLLALCAMLFFLCHPRLHGHSFFNSKDTPFLSMFAIALLLAHWALGRGGVRAHAVLGAWIGLIGSVRPIAFLLVPLVALAQSMDFLRASRRERMRFLVVFAVQALAAAAAFFVALPYLWGAPVERFAQWFALMADHTHVVGSLFMGELINTDDRPWLYLPVWFAVTTPPLVIVLALVGGAAFAVRIVRSPSAALTNTRLGFETLLAASIALSIVIVTFFIGNVYNGWRHLYFLYAPVCLFACAGLAWLVRNSSGKLAALVGAVTVFGFAPIVGWIALLHPHQHVYFNLLVDRKTPERLRSQFDMDYWTVSLKEALEFLLRSRPQGRIPVAGPIAQSIHVLPSAERNRIVRSNRFSAYFASDYRYWWGEGVVEGGTYARPVHVRKVFSNTLYAIVRLEVTLKDSPYELDYRRALSSAPVARERFRVYWDGEAITYVGEDCQPSDVEGRIFETGPWPPARRFFLHVVGDKLSAPASRGVYRHNEDFQFRHRGIVFAEGKSRVCMARVDLNGYRVDAMRTGQLDSEGKPAWSASVAAIDADALGRALSRVSALEPAARGRFDVHIDEGALIYVKERCRREDLAQSFFLHVVPSDLDDVAPAVAQRGFAHRDFALDTHGAMLGDVCVLRVPLPPFRARAARTGQHAPGRGEFWRVEVDLSNRANGGDGGK